MRGILLGLGIGATFLCYIDTKTPKMESVYRLENQNKTVLDTQHKTITVFVALCDNKYQGIVPVPAGIGNGQEPKSNLYWGCGYGVKTYFTRSPNWHLIATRKGQKPILETLIFEHKKTKTFLIAYAYDGRDIKTCTQDFLAAASGKAKDTLIQGAHTIGASGNSDLLAYVGHNGLMDFSISELYENTDKKKRNTIVLACYSRAYFSQHLQKANVYPLVWSTHLMSPEAYTLHDALEAYLANADAHTVRQKAAEAYAKYQKCGTNAAKNLLVTGW